MKMTAENDMLTEQLAQLIRKYQKKTLNNRVLIRKHQNIDGTATGQITKDKRLGGENGYVILVNEDLPKDK